MLDKDPVKVTKVLTHIQFHRATPGVLADLLIELKLSEASVERTHVIVE